MRFKTSSLKCWMLSKIWSFHYPKNRYFIYPIYPIAFNQYNKIIRIFVTNYQRLFSHLNFANFTKISLKFHEKLGPALYPSPTILIQYFQTIFFHSITLAICSTSFRTWCFDRTCCSCGSPSPIILMFECFISIVLCVPKNTGYRGIITLRIGNIVLLGFGDSISFLQNECLEFTISIINF